MDRMGIAPLSDAIVFGPWDVDLGRSPLRGCIQEETHVLGAFNPGLTRLPNGNLLMMVRVAEALREPVRDDHVLALRWSAGQYVIDRHNRSGLDERDPRALKFAQSQVNAPVLTSLSWLLPVELSADGSKIVAIHYDRIIAPAASYQQYGVEDPRISRIDDRWYMTTCSVSAERHCTTLYTSDNALDWRLEGIVLDHQNKDMLLFEGRVGDWFMALTRPMGDSYFAYPPGSDYVPGPAIQFARSPDALHWKPMDAPGIRPRRGSRASMKVGGGTPPVLTKDGWLAFYHGVELRGVVGVYRTFWALFDRDEPTRILRLEDGEALLEARADLSADMAPLRYLNDVVFTTGVASHGDDWIIASGEDDLACRITVFPKSAFV